MLHSFGKGSDGANPVAGMIDVSGKLYGTTQNGGAYKCGTVFGITTGGTEKVAHSFGKYDDACYPEAGVTDVSGTLYGTTRSGGYSGYGTVFSLKP